MSLHIMEHFIEKGNLLVSLNDLDVETEKECLLLTRFAYVKEPGRSFILCRVDLKDGSNGKISQAITAGRYSIEALIRDTRIEGYIGDLAGFGQVS